MALSGIETKNENPARGVSIFTSQGLVLLLLTNALTPYEPQTGDMQIDRSDQPPKEVVRK